MVEPVLVILIVFMVCVAFGVVVESDRLMNEVRNRMTSETVASEFIKSVCRRFDAIEKNTKSRSPHTFATDNPMSTRILSGSESQQYNTDVVASGSFLL